MYNKKNKLKQAIIAASMTFMAASPVMAQDSNIERLNAQIAENGDSGYISDAEFKKAMESLAKQEALMERKAQLRKFQVESGETKDASEEEEEVEPTLEQKLNPPKDAKQVSIEFFDLMEKEYQKNLYDLRQQIKSLKEQIQNLKDPDNKDMIQENLYVTEIYSVGNNKYATMMWDFHFFEDTTEGEEVVDGVKVLSINDKGVQIQKEDGSKHFIYKISKRRALENAWAARQEAKAIAAWPQDDAQRPEDINIRPPMGMGMPSGASFGQGGFGNGAGTGELPIFPQ